MLTLADVSEFQTVDWAKYGASCPAVIVRAAVTYWSDRQGKTIYRADNKWAANLAGSRKYCQWRGFYQYLDKTADPVAAAKYFAATTGPLLPGEVAILDIEEGDGDQRARRRAWLDTLQAATEWTYSGLYYARAHLPGVPLDWIAAYQSNEPTDAHVLWQNTNAQAFPGIGTCDGNRFNGSLAELIALTTSTEADMPLTDDDVKKIWGFAGLDNATGGAQTIWRTITEAGTNARLVPTLQNQVKTLQAAVDALAEAKGADADAITKAVVDKINALKLTVTAEGA